jgi:hypothetical protein
MHVVGEREIVWVEIFYLNGLVDGVGDGDEAKLAMVIVESYTT